MRWLKHIQTPWCSAILAALLLINLRAVPATFSWSNAIHGQWRRSGMYGFTGPVLIIDDGQSTKYLPVRPDLSDVPDTLRDSVVAVVEQDMGTDELGLLHTLATDVYHSVTLRSDSAFPRSRSFDHDQFDTLRAAFIAEQARTGNIDKDLSLALLDRRPYLRRLNPAGIALDLLAILNAAALIVSLGWIPNRIRERLRRPRLLWDRKICLNCGYDLSSSIPDANSLITCPECNTVRTPVPPK
jgi:hypothetical protein